MLMRRIREQLNADVLTVGTSATMVTDGGDFDRRHAVARVATRLFGTAVAADHVVSETLERITPADVDISREALASGVRTDLPDTITYDKLREHPLAAWIELNLGLDREDGKWVKNPRSANVRGGRETARQ